MPFVTILRAQQVRRVNFMQMNKKPYWVGCLLPEDIVGKIQAQIICIRKYTAREPCKCVAKRRLVCPSGEDCSEKRRVFLYVIFDAAAALMNVLREKSKKKNKTEGWRLYIYFARGISRKLLTKRPGVCDIRIERSLYDSLAWNRRNDSIVAPMIIFIYLVRTCFRSATW